MFCTQYRWLHDNTHTVFHCVSPGDWELSGKNKKSSFPLLTCQADQRCAHEQVHHQLAVLRCSGHKEGDDDLSWDVELECVGEEDADGVEQLNGLVQPAERAGYLQKPAQHALTSSERRQKSPTATWGHLFRSHTHVLQAQQFHT